MIRTYNDINTRSLFRLDILKRILINSLLGLALIGPVYGQTTDEEIEPVNRGSAIRVTRVNPEAMGMLKGTEAPLLDRYKCDKTFLYKLADICLNKHPEFNGDVLTVESVYSGSRFVIGATEGCFLRGVFQDKILVDYGTSNIRRLEIYDISGRRLLELQYAGELSVQSGRLNHWVLKTREELETIPDCAKTWQRGEDTLGFIQEQVLDLRSLVVSPTGKSDCLYME